MAEFRLSSPSLPLVSLVKSLPSSRIECVHGLCLERDSRVFVVYFAPTDNVSEEDLSSFEEIADATVLGRSSGRDIYQLTVDLDDLISEAFASERFTAAQMEPTIITPEGWHEKKIFESDGAFDGFTDRCEDYSISVERISIEQTSSSSSTSSQYGLTNRQHEALTLAISRGYFESPRQTSTEELAEEMGISQPSMSSLLRRGERQLLSSTLGPQTNLRTLSR